jgi:hypothetical protein
MDTSEQEKLNEKREEIRSEIRRIIAESTLPISSIVDENEVHHFTHGAVHLDRATDAIMKRESDLGVMIKVDRELHPDPNMNGTLKVILQQSKLSTVEPLIEGV